MPQFEPTYFATQIFWLAISVIALYFLLSRIALPRIAGVMEQRAQRIANDLERAEELKQETDGIIRAYEDALAKARQEAADLLAGANQEMARTAAERQAEFGRELGRRIEEAEARIAEAKAAAQSGIRDVAEDIASDIVDKLIGAAPPDEAVRKSVDQAMPEPVR